MFLKIIFTKKMCINYKTYHLKNKQKLKIILFGCSKSIHIIEKFSF